MEQADPKAVSEALSIADQLRETMQSDGWKWIRQIIEDNIKSMNDIDGVKSFKELQAKQYSSKVLKSFLADLDGILQASERVNSVTTITDPRYRIFKLHG